MSVLVGVFVVFLLLWLVFRDTMNRVQYIQFLRIYWIIRDTGVLGTPFIIKSFMRQTSEPWWVGSGFQVRVYTYTFQVGYLKYRSSDLLSQLEGRYMSSSPKEIRKWK